MSRAGALQRQQFVNRRRVVSLLEGGYDLEGLSRSVAAHVDALMHGGAATPLVQLDTPMRDVIYEMSRKGLGMTCVVDAEGHLAGIVTDGDLRRHLTSSANLLERRATDIMTKAPVSISPRVLAVE